MLPIQRILCPLDFSEISSLSLEYAQSFAKHYSAELLALHALEPMEVAYPDDEFVEAWSEARSRRTAEAKARLQALVEAHPSRAPSLEMMVREGRPSDAILAEAERHAADLIVMGTHGRRGMDRWLLGSVTEKVLRKARCPVLVVRKPAHPFISAQPAEDPVRLERLLVCSDFSEPSLRALEHAISLAMEFDAELRILHVVEEIPGSKEVQEFTEEIQNKLTEPIPAETREWLRLKAIVRIGRPYQEIIQLALESETDLIIMGVQGRNALDLAVFGSTTHRVIQLGPCPVLAVRVP